MADIPIFVLSLKECGERFDSVHKELARFGLAPIRVRAVDGRRKSSLLKRACGRSFYCGRLGRAMAPGEIGCYASHLKALRQIVRSRIPRAIILEDDAVLSDQFGKFYQFDLPRLLNAVDIVKLEGVMFPHTSRDGLTVFRGSSCRGIVPMKPTANSAAYAVTLRGARSLVAAIRKFSEPYDFVLIGYERYEARYCEVRPFPVSQSDAGSVIGDTGRHFSGRNDLGLAARISFFAHRGVKAFKRVAIASRTWLSMHAASLP